MPRSRSRYRPRKRAQRMYRHYDRYGTAGMSRRQIQELARESDIGVNPRRRRRYRRGRNPVFFNPKRDGSPTRGEVRRTKYVAHLDALIQRSEETRAKLKLIKKAPIGSTTPHHYEQHAPLKTGIREEAMREISSDRAERAVPAVIASAAVESKVMSQAMRDLNEAHAFLLTRLKELGDEGPDDEIAEIQSQIVDIAKQKRKLRAEATEPVAANPYRRRNPYRRNPHQRSNRSHRGRTWRLRGLPAYARALGRYCDAVHHYCTRPRRR